MKTPAADREVLVLLAGLAWTAVGLLLMAGAVYWLTLLERGILPVVAVGVIAGLIIYRFGFAILAEGNLMRIYSQAPEKKKVCVFAFQNTRSYFIVMIMMALGYILRQSSLPRSILASIYIAIGLALFLASIKYYSYRNKNAGQ
jgi:hypothetical protein